jgi:hypothetical protein
MKFLAASVWALGASTAAAFLAPQLAVHVQKKTSQILSSSSPRSILKMSDSEVKGFASAFASDYESLGLPARQGRSLKVAIAGGGVGGLTAALCMLKKGFDVTVYEKTAAFARFGGPIQFASNALSVLKEIDEGLFDRVMDKFTFTGPRACGIKDGRFHFVLWT